MAELADQAALFEAIAAGNRDRLDLFRCESAILRTHWVLVVMDRYFNGHRTHAGLGGMTPEPRTGEESARASVSRYRWRLHCRGLYQTPIAA